MPSPTMMQELAPDQVPTLNKTLSCPSIINVPKGRRHSKRDSRCSTVSCELYHSSTKLRLREGDLFMRGKYLPRRKQVHVELYLLPPMIIYRGVASKVVHLDHRFEVERHATSSDSIVLKNKACPREFIFDLLDEGASGTVDEWVKDIQSAVQMCSVKRLLSLEDFIPFEQAIDKFQEAHATRNLTMAEDCVETMESTLSAFLVKYEDVEVIQCCLGDKYTAWLQCARERLQEWRSQQ